MAKLPLSDMSQEYWTNAVTDAAAAAHGSNDDQISQFYEKLIVHLEPYEFSHLITTLEDWGGGYRSQWNSNDNLFTYALKDGSHYYEAWVIS
ncbi:MULTISPECIES: hypothetical protein [unclassified Pseudoalteromonas]|uniref:hypothetical protein n=1 Tax=unclassified Pseudoalteromonas TaxID=194690 RepID=UPI0006B49589|nr:MULTISPECIES: hypothetical protein [unclassified Pseudoalteromonas]AZZ97463.1 hypothetical protein ELR70_10220 [Pseudoalteromonas sp. R3]MCO7186800.1 hypothetical protein [Pseudoalteromonas sp. XMcav2-N]